MAFLGSDHVMIGTCSVITTNCDLTSLLILTIAVAASITINAITFAAEDSFAINSLVTTVVVRPRIILTHICVAMALLRPRRVLLTPAVVVSRMIAANKAAVMEHSLPDLLPVSQVDVVGKCLDRKTTRLLS